MNILDEITTVASVGAIFDTVRAVEAWPRRLSHYRYVRFRERTSDGGGLVEMSANRPFGWANWPTWWLSEMAVDSDRPAIRFRHVGGITRGMDVEWSFHPLPGGGTQVRLLHVWEGPRWAIIGPLAAVAVIGPVFIHAIASRTMAGLALASEQARAEKAS
jgi:ribosome-associated toxin RatA of RatAB toxin-antitoxin module